MEKCATGVCVPVGSWMENKPLVIGLAVLVFALIVGGYFWWRGRGASAAAATEPAVEEFVGRQEADFQQQPPPEASPEAPQEGEHQHEE